MPSHDREATVERSRLHEDGPEPDLCPLDARCAGGSWEPDALEVWVSPEDLGTCCHRESVIVIDELLNRDDEARRALGYRRCHGRQQDDQCERVETLFLDRIAVAFNGERSHRLGGPPSAAVALTSRMS